MSSSSPTAASPASQDGSDFVISANPLAVLEPRLSRMDDPPTNHSFKSRILPHFTRMKFSPVMNRRTLESSIAALYDHLDAQTDVVDSYYSLEDALRKQDVRYNRLERELRSFQELLPPLSRFILDRYKRLHERYDATIKKAHDFEDELSLRAGQSQEIAI